MTEKEFEILDQLYFVTSFNELQEQVDFEENEIVDVLQNMLQKDWIRVYHDGENEVISEDIDLRNKYASYYFLASKKGLFAHNSK